MLKYPQEGIDLEVEVTVNGHLMKGHNATRDSNMITQYIEASAGTEFEVEYSIIGLNTANKDVRVSCYVDGTLVRKPIHRSSGLRLWCTHPE